MRRRSGVLNKDPSDANDESLDLQEVDSVVGKEEGRKRVVSREGLGFRKWVSRDKGHFKPFALFRRIRTKLIYQVQRFGVLGWIGVFLLPLLVDLAWVTLYFVERQQDLSIPDGPCADSMNKPSPPTETGRSFGVWLTQAVFSFCTVFGWMVFRIFYVGSYKFRHWLMVLVLLDLGISIPFIIGVFFKEARVWYVPSFLRIWMARFSLGFLVSHHTLRGEVFLFLATGVAVLMTMVACFEWAQNNFAANTTIFVVEDSPEEFACTDFFTSLYFIIVTLSTVGYGDVLAINVVARVFVTLTIIIFIVLLPITVSKVTDLIYKSRDRRHIGYSARTEVSHIVIHGHLDERILIHALYFFNPVRRARRLIRGEKIAENEISDESSFSLEENSIEHAAYVVAMSEDSVSEDMLSRIELGFQRSYIFLYEGSLLEPEDLRRCQISRASAVLILPLLHVLPDGTAHKLPDTLDITADPSTSHLLRKAVSRNDGAHRRHEDSKDEPDGIEEALRTHQKKMEIKESLDHVNRASEARTRLYTRDYRTLLRAWSAHQNMHSDQLLVVLLFHDFNKQFLFDNGADPELCPSNPLRNALLERNLLTISIDTFQQEVLAASCLVPGFSTLLTNMFIGEDREVFIPAYQRDGKGLSSNPGLDYNVDVAIEINESDSEKDEDDSNQESGRGDPERALRGLRFFGISNRKLGDSMSSDPSSPPAVPSNKFNASNMGVGSPQSDSGFVFKSSRHIGAAFAGNGETGNEASCGCKGSLLSVIRGYTRGMQNEIDIMIVGKDNPFIGWSRLELAITVNRDFRVIVLSIVPGQLVRDGNQHQVPLELFSDPHEIVQSNDHIVLLGRGQGLDDLFNTKTGDYDMKEGSRKAMHFLHHEQNRKKRATLKQTEGEDQILRTRSEFASETKEHSIGRSLSDGVAYPGRRDEVEDEEDALTADDGVPENLFATEGVSTSQKDLHQIPENVSVAEVRPLEFAFVKEFNKDLKQDRKGKHIILCAPATSPIEMFIRCVRAHSNREKSSPKILWLVSETPSDLIWKRVSRFKNVFWMLGEACLASDLMRAGITHASDIVLFSDYFQRYNPDPSRSGQAIETFDVDRYVISSHRVISSVANFHKLEKLRIHTHLVAPENGIYLHESRWKRFIHFDCAEGNSDVKKPEHVEGNDSWTSIFRRFKGEKAGDRAHALQVLSEHTGSNWPILLDESYASGEVWSASSLFFVLFSSYVGGSYGLMFTVVENMLKAAGKRAHKDGEKHGLRLVKIPPIFHGQPYQKLYIYCLARFHSLSLGLFRGFGHGMNSREFGKPTILVNPGDMIIQPCDYLYLLGGKKGHMDHIDLSEIDHLGQQQQQ